MKTRELTQDEIGKVEAILRENEKKGEILISIKHKTKIKRLSGFFSWNGFLGHCSNCNSKQISKEYIPYKSIIIKERKIIHKKGEYDTNYFCRTCSKESKDIRTLAPDFHLVYDGF